MNAKEPTGPFLDSDILATGDQLRYVRSLKAARFTLENVEFRQGVAHIGYGALMYIAITLLTTREQFRRPRRR